LAAGANHESSRFYLPRLQLVVRVFSSSVISGQIVPKNVDGNTGPRIIDKFLRIPGTPTNPH
jgi:hypothetical protein